MWWKRRDGGSNEPSAQELFERGASLLETDLDSARRCYERAVELEPGFSGAWFDLGLTHKWRREWIDTLACNRRAIDVQEEPEEGDPAFWNAGIAATALHDWASARWAWRGYGIPIDDGDGEIVADFGLGVVRLPSGETVWCRRIDPTRMKVLSVPLPESGFRCRDILLHDGAPEGTRVAFGREYSVMAFIEMWAATDVPTTEILVDASGSAVDDLMERLHADGEVMAENWKQTVQMLCAACSSGRVDYDHPDHDHGSLEEVGYTRIGCSGAEETLATIVAAWQAESGGVVQQMVVHHDRREQ